MSASDEQGQGHEAEHGVEKWPESRHQATNLHRAVRHRDHPRRPRPVHPVQLGLEPPHLVVLGERRREIGVERLRADRDHADRADLEAVPEGAKTNSLYY